MMENAINTMGNAACYREKPDALTNPAGEVGWYLQRERERLGLTREAVAAACDIPVADIRAIEDGDLHDLPPQAEALQQLSALADFLGFEPKPLTRQYAKFLSLGPEEPQERESPATTAEPFAASSDSPLTSSMTTGDECAGGWLKALTPFRVMTSAALGAFGLAAVYIGSSWNPDPPQVLGEAQTPEIETGAPRDVSSVTAISQIPLTDDRPRLVMVADSPTSPDSVSDDGDSALGALIARQLTAPEAASPEPTADSAANSPSEPPGPAPRILGDASGQSRLVLTAHDDILIRIVDRDGRLGATESLRKGDHYHVPDRKGLTLIARDGGVLSYTIDGVDRGLLGARGEIIIGLQLDPEQLAARRG